MSKPVHFKYHLKNGLTFDNSSVLEHFSAAASMTPVPTGASGDITTETSTGRWCRIGPMVFLVLKTTIATLGDASGDLTITLPAAVPAAADISMDQPLSLSHSGLEYGEGELEVSAKILSNTKTIQLQALKDDAAPAVVDAQAMTVEIAGCYFAE